MGPKFLILILYCTPRVLFFEELDIQHNDQEPKKKRVISEFRWRKLKKKR